MISHLTRLKMKIKDHEMLIRCFKEMGYQVREGGVINGFLDDHSVDIAVTISSGYDIGFVRDTDGTYNIVTDWWPDKSAYEDSFSNQLAENFFKKLEQKVRQSYALNKTLEQLKYQGYNVIKKEQAEDGTIKLLARRWA